MICEVDSNGIVTNLVDTDIVVKPNERPYYPWLEMGKEYTDEMPKEYADKQTAEETKSVLEIIAISAMMATLAGSDITVQKTEYQSNIATLSDDVALLIPEVYPVWSGNGFE